MGVAFLRTIILYVFVILALRIMGKRQIGELQPSELVVTILISELAAIPMQDVGIPIFNGIIPILTLLACEMIISFVMLKNIRLREFFTGRPSILVKNGVINQAELKKLRYTIDDLMEELRLKGAANIEDVGSAIMETNGKLSVFLKGNKSPATPEIMNLNADDKLIPVPLIIDGRLLKKNLPIVKMGIDDVNKILTQNNISSIKEVFFLYTETSGKTTIIKKEDI